MQQQIDQSYALCGYLEKKSPSLLQGWQKRYFQVRDSGKMLLYYQNAPNDNYVKPKGIIHIQKLLSASIVVTSRVEFVLNLQESQIQLRTLDEESRQHWIDTLTFLMGIKAKEGKLVQYKQLSLDEILGSSSEIPSEASKIKNTSHTDRYIPYQYARSDLDKYRIKLEDEKLKHLKNESQLDEINDEVLKAKGIYPFLANYKSEVVNRHVISGFLMKKGKLAKLTVVKRRWFFMISSVALNGEMEGSEKINSSEILQGLNLDQIYYFKYDFKGDKTNFCGNIQVDQFEKPELMNLKSNWDVIFHPLGYINSEYTPKSDSRLLLDKNLFIEAIKVQKISEYGFTLQGKEGFRSYNIFSDYLTDINRWNVAIQAVQSRPQKVIQIYSSSLSRIPKEDNNFTFFNQLANLKVIFESQVELKHQNQLLTGPLSWQKVTLQLYDNLIKWSAYNKDREEITHQQVFLINILKVRGGRVAWVIFTTDSQQFKFRADSVEKQGEWVKKIQDQFVLNKKTFTESDQSTDKITTTHQSNQQQIFHSKLRSEITIFEQQYFTRRISKIEEQFDFIEDEKSNSPNIDTKIEEINDDVLRDKGIYPFLSKYDPLVISRHVISGFLMKKGRLTKQTPAKKRWFFMISSVAIGGEQVMSEKINQSEIPSVFRLDSIYYFKYDFKGDQTKYNGNILVNQCEPPEVMGLGNNSFVDTINQQKLPKYGFTLESTKDCRSYNFFSDHLKDINRWMLAIQAVQAKPNRWIQKDCISISTIPAEINDKDKQLNDVKVIFESQAYKKHQNKLLTGPLSWKKVTLQLQEHIIKWNSKKKSKEENTNQYVYLTNILRVKVGRISWVIFSYDGYEFKFKVSSIEKRDEWVKKIQDQIIINQGNVGYSKTCNLNSINKSDGSDEDNEDKFTSALQRKMQQQMKNNKQNEENYDDQETSCFSKVFCCFNVNKGKEKVDKGF